MEKNDQAGIPQEDIPVSPNTQALLRAVMTFVLGACLRRWQQAEAGEKKRRYAMIIQNDTQEAAIPQHIQIVDRILAAAAEAANTEPQELRAIFETAFADLSASIKATQGCAPHSDQAFELFIEGLRGGQVLRETVNSVAVGALLNERAQLRLRAPFNIALGGDLLGRQITVPNLIAFYLSCSTESTQVDTRLRNPEVLAITDPRDLAVTRFYAGPMM